ncbi:MAG: hypothetical protein ABFS45_12190 [Pseudomonadota bacterium]
MKLIRRYQKIQADLEAYIKDGRPVCQALAGDLMALAEQLHCTDSAQDFIRELHEQSQQGQPSSPGRIFHGVID